MDLAWEQGNLAHAEVTALKDRTCTMLHAAGRYVVKDAAGKDVPCETDGHRLRFPVKAGQAYLIEAMA